MFDKFQEIILINLKQESKESNSNMPFFDRTKSQKGSDSLQSRQSKAEPLIAAMDDSDWDCLVQSKTWTREDRIPS